MVNGGLSCLINRWLTRETDKKPGKTSVWPGFKTQKRRGFPRRFARVVCFFDQRSS
jgi:hypothetical protein